MKKSKWKSRGYSGEGRRGVHCVFSVSQGAADCGEDWEDGVILSGFYSRDRIIEVRMNKTNGLPENS